MGKKALVIGLDGVPHSLLASMIQQGVMPFLHGIASDNAFGAMEVTLPPISSVSWTSFATGAPPCHHGIFGFTDITRDHALGFPTFLDVKCPTLFDKLGETGRRSIVINLPATYPARAFPGVLISGFVAPDLARAVFPPTLLPRLQAMQYRIDVDLAAIRANPALLYPELHATLASRHTLAATLLEEEEWDLFFLVITGTDRLHHFHFDHWADEHNDARQSFLDYYTAVDGVLQQLCTSFLARHGDDEHMMMFLSDHGFTSLQQEVYCNTVLQESGYLRFMTDTPRMISHLDPAHTRAFVLDPGRIYLNRTDRFARGTVSPADVPTLRAEIEALFRSLTFGHQPVFQDVRRREDLYSGPCAHLAPDLVLVPHRGFDPKGAISNEIFKRGALTGMHTHDDAFWIVASERPFTHPRTILDCSTLLTSFFTQER